MTKENRFYREKDNINPEHYTQGGLEVFDILKAKLTSEELEGFCKGNIIKYLFREKYKNGFECLLKCHWYLTKLIIGRYNRMNIHDQKKYHEYVSQMQSNKTTG